MPPVLFFCDHGTFRKRKVFDGRVFVLGIEERGEIRPHRRL